jgi:asparagine synthase (glutamine-hydrolysing)
LDRFAEAAAMTPDRRYWRLAAIAGENEAAALFLNYPVPCEYFDRKYHYLSVISPEGDLNDVLYADMHLVLRNDMLVKVDMMSMANSLEVRVPFLDHEHVDYVFSLPWFFKAGRDFRKKILKDAFSEMLPESIQTRGKHGFEVPLLRWFRTELRSMIHHELLSPEFLEAQGLFRSDVVSGLLRRLDSPDPGDAAARVWGLIVFQSWWKKYMEI